MKLSGCKGCRTRFQPWELRCPKCGRSLPIVGAAAILVAALMAYLFAQAGLRIGLW